MLTLAYFARLIERMYFTDPLPETTEAPATTEAVAAADGGEELDDEHERSVSTAMIALVVLAAVASVVLGFLGSDIAALLDPLFDGVFGQ